MKLCKVCLVLLIAAGFSACEVQGTVKDTVKGTPSKSDTILPAKFVKYQHSENVEEAKENKVPTVFKR
jgi:hypothetical protein